MKKSNSLSLHDVLVPISVASNMLLSVTLVGCGAPQSTTVRIVLPNGFEGAFVVVEDEVHGDNPWRDGTFGFDVPENRIVRVTCCDPLREGCNPAIQYANGEPLPFGNHLNQSQGGVTDVALWMGPYGDGSRYGRRFHFFVGTQEAFHSFDFDSFLPGTPPPVQ